MSPERQRIVLATLCGWRECRPRASIFSHPWISGYNPNPNKVVKVIELDGTEHEPSNTQQPETLPDYLNDLNTVHAAEKILDEQQYSRWASSNPNDHASMRYLHILGKICGLEAREELVVSVADEDKDKLNFRPGPYPTPIQLPPSATILGHYIPAYGHELILIRATAAQRIEALLKAVKKWENDES